MRQCGSVNWYKVGQWVVMISLLFVFSIARAQNLPPVVNLGIPNQHTEVGSSFSYTIPSSAFKDANGGTLNYSVENLPSGMSFVGKTISGKAVAGSWVVTVTADDQSGGKASTSFTIFVHAAGTTYAAFSMDANRGCGSKTVQFINQSNNAASFEWNLGNGNYSTLPNPIAIYTEANTYTVTLTITGDDGLSYSYSDKIYIYDTPEPSIDENSIADGCEPYTVTLTSNGDAGVYYYWYCEEFDTVSHYTTTNSITLSNLKNNTYDVALEVTDANGCTGNTIYQSLFEVHAQPKASFKYDKTDKCKASLTTFTNTSTVEGSTITGHSWKINGVQVGTDKDLSYKFTTSGTYVVSLVETSENGCNSEAYTDTVKFNANNHADFEFTPSQAVCKGTPIYFSPKNVSDSVAGYNWNFEGTTVPGANQTWNFNKAGHDTVTLTTRFNDGCEITTSKQVSIDSIAANFNYSVTGTCLDNFTISLNDQSASMIGAQITSVKWFMDMGSNNFQQIYPPLTEQKAGTYRIKLEVMDATCSSSVIEVITLTNSSLSFSISGATSGCSGSGETNFTTIFQSGYDSITSYSWDFDDGTTPSTEKNPTHTFGEGNFTVSLSVTTKNGCHYSYAKNNAVQFADPPVINSIQMIQSNYCMNSEVTFNTYYTSGTDHVQYTTNETSSQTDEEEVSDTSYSYNHTFNNFGTFDLTAIAIDNGCSSDPFTVSGIRIDGPKAGFTTASLFCNVKEVDFTNKTKTNRTTPTYQWDFGDGNSSTETSPTHAYSDAGDYTVSLTATDTVSGCFDTYQQTIHIFTFENTASDIISVSDNSGCAPLENISFTPNIAEYVSDNFNNFILVWDFNNDGISDDTTANVLPVEYTFEKPGIYTTVLHVTGNGCDFTTDYYPITVLGPLIDFSISSPACSGSPVTFTNLSTQPAGGTVSSYGWDFGDGNTSSTENTTHTFASAGAKTVSLKITDSIGCSDTLSKTFTIEPFSAGFTPGSTTVCEGNAVTFTNNSSGNGLTYKWDFGDGATSLATDASHAYSSPNDYQVTLTATTINGCTKTDSQIIHVVNTSADFTAAATKIGCAPADASFTPEADSADVESYSWNFGDGITSGERAPTHRYYTPGIYTVSLTITFTSGCDSTVTRNDYITVDGAYGILSYDGTPSCSPNVVEFTLTGMQNVDYIQWDFGNGGGKKDTISTDTTTFSTTYTYTAVGYTKPSVMLTSTACAKSYAYEKASSGTPIKIYTSTPPDASFTTNYNDICQGVPIKFTDTSTQTDSLYPANKWYWDFDDTDSATDTRQNPVHAYKQVGSVTPKLVISNALGCSDTDSSSIYIHSQTEIKANIDVPEEDNTLVCPGINTDFRGSAKTNNNSIIGWKWDFGDGDSTDTQEASHTYSKDWRSKPIEVMLVATDDKLCSDSTFRTVDINNLQAALGYSPQPVYRGDTVDFADLSTITTGHPVVSWNWHFENGNLLTPPGYDTTEQVDYQTIDTNQVKLIVIDNTGCSDTTTRILPVLNNPPVISSFEISFLTNLSYSFTLAEFEDHFDTSKDPSQQLEQLKITSLPAHGTLYLKGIEVNQDQIIENSDIANLTYFSSFIGDDSFTWNASDGIDFALSVATVTIHILPEPPPPTLDTLYFEIAEDSVLRFPASLFADIAYFNNPNFPGFYLDTLQILSLPGSDSTLLKYNGTVVKAGNSFDTTGWFTVDLPYHYNEGTVSFEWNGFDSYSWGETPAKVIINYKNEPPILKDIIRDGLNEDSKQTITKDEFLKNYSDKDSTHDTPKIFFLIIPNGTPGTFTINNNQSISSISFDLLSYVTYTPGKGYHGTVDVQWGASDGQDTTYAVLHLGFINTPPVAYDVTVYGKEDNSLSFYTTDFSKEPRPFYDIDPNDDLDSILIQSLPKHGYLTYKPLSTVEETLTGLTIIQSNMIGYRLVYHPEPNWFGVDTFLYAASDESSFSNESGDYANVIIKIEPVDDPPVALNDTISTSEDTPSASYNIILANDSDIDDTISALKTQVRDGGTAESNGTIDLDTEGNLIYTPNHDFYGQVSFTYRLCDPSDSCDIATVFINIGAVNDPPDATDDIISILETVKEYNSNDTTNLLYNDIDPEGNDKVIVTAGGSVPGTTIQGTFGDLVVNTEGNFEYALHKEIDSLAKGEIVTDRFFYIAEDLPGGDTASAWLIIHIVGVNSPPNAENDLASVDENVPLSNPGFTLLDNDDDPENDPLKIISIDGDTSGALSNDKGNLQWGSDGKFSYLQGENGALFDNLRENSTQEVIFTYTVADNQDSTSTAQLIITIIGKNDPPVADNDSLTFPEGADSVEIKNTNPAAFNIGDWDPDIGDYFGIISVNNSTSTSDTTSIGILKWGSDGNYIYIPNYDTIVKLQDGQFAQDVFTYIIRDDYGATDTATLTITIRGKNDNPVSNDDTLTILEDQFITSIPAESGLLVNDSDPENDPMVVAINDSTSWRIKGMYGTLEWDSTGAYTYYSDTAKVNPFPEGSVYEDKFQYRMKDSIGADSRSYLHILITGQNDPPVAIDDSADIHEGDDLERLSYDTGLLYNDSDIDLNDSFSVTRVDDDTLTQTPGTYGELHWNSDGSYTYILNEGTDSLSLGEVVVDTFQYLITDLHDSTAIANLIIRITGNNSTPVAINNSVSIPEDTLVKEYYQPDALLLFNDYDVDGDTIWMISMDNQAVDSIALHYCSIKWDSTGKFTYYRNPELDTLSIGTEIVDSVQYKITDTYGALSDAWLCIHIIGENDAPVAARDNNSLTETTPSVISNKQTNLLNNDSDIDINDSISVIKVDGDTLALTSGIYGKLKWNNNGTYTYYNYLDSLATDSLYQGEEVYDIFPYTISDREGATATEELWIKMTGVNDNPVAINDTLTLDEDDFPIQVFLLANDTDVDGDESSVTNFNQTDSIQYGTITWDQHGIVEFSINPLVDSLQENETVYEHFKYVIEDPFNGLDSALLTIIINGENDIPVALNDTVRITEDTDSISGGATDFYSSLLDSVLDVDNDSLIVSLINFLSDTVSPGDYGRLEWDSLGNYTYFTNTIKTDSLARGEIVSDVFTYTVSDKKGGQATAFLVISILGINDPPKAHENYYHTLDRIAITATATPLDTSNILYNDTDVDSEIKTMTAANESANLTTNGKHGVLSWNSDGSFVYLPDSAKAVSLRPLQTVTDTFTYFMEDDYHAADTSLLHFVIEGINNAPLAWNDTLDTNEDVISASLPAPGLLVPQNVIDPDKDTLKVYSINNSFNDSISGALGYGYIKWDNEGNVTFYPYQDVIHQLAYGEYVTETFTYTIIDQGDLTDNAKLIVNILGLNDPVEAVDDYADVREDTLLIYNVVENDKDIDNDGNGNFDYGSLTVVDQPSHGIASRNSATGEIFYRPDKNFFGQDSLKYNICDKGIPVYCDEAWFHITVTPVNDPPADSTLVLYTPINTPVGFDYLPLVTDIDDGINPASLEYPIDNPKISNQGNQLIYTPETDFSGKDEFIYSLKDYTGETGYGIVTVIVGDSASSFWAQNDSIATKEDTSVDIDILANDTLGGENPDPRSVEIKLFPGNGVAVFDPTLKVISYTPDENYNGTDQLSYIVSSGTGNWSSAKVFITVTPVNDPFAARDDFAETLIDTPVSIDVTANDPDPDNLINSLAIASKPGHGDVLVESTSNIQYIPETGFIGIDTFYYKVCDTLSEPSACDSAMVFVNIAPAPEDKLFEAENDDYTTNENTPLELVPLPIENDDHVKGVSVAPESFSIISGPLNGTYFIPNDTIVYTPATDFHDIDWMQYIVADEEGNWDMAEINIRVIEINNPPVAVNDTYIVTQNDYKRLFVLENDYDTDGFLDNTTLQIITAPHNGAIQIDPNTGTVLYKPSVNTGDDSFTYQICDNLGACSEIATVNITIELQTTIYIWKTTPEDTPVSIDIAGKMAEYNLNFTIKDILKEVDPELGSYAFTSNNSEIIYTPSTDANGRDTIYLQVWPADHSETAYLRIFIIITPVNDAPVAVADTLHWINAPDAKVIPFDSLLINDYDVDGDSIRLSPSFQNNENIITGYDGLTITVDSINKNITLFADTIYWCNAWFIYEIADGNGLFDSDTVYIWPPLKGITAIEDSATVAENSQSNSIDVLLNDSIVDNQRCTIDTVIILTPPLHGTAIGTIDNFVSYTPKRHYFGNDSLEYKIIDRWGQSDSAWVYLTILERNIPPVAVDDTVTNQGTSINIPALNNDYDPDAIGTDGDTLAHIVPGRTLFTSPSYGTVIFDSINSIFIYTPESKSCVDSFSYIIFDNEGASDTGIVTIDFSKSPVYAITDTVKTYPGIQTKDVEPLANDSGYFVPELTEYTETYTLHGTVSWNSNNIVNYTPDPDFIGRDSILYTIFSPCGVEQSAWIIFSVEELRVPQIITPNDDGKNDVLIIDGIEYFPDSWLQIYNRYGHIVYEKKHYDNTWGGYSNKGSLGGDKPLPAATYYYTLTYNDGKNRQAGFIYIFW